MSTLRGALVVLGGGVVLGGVLLATGVVRLGTPATESATPPGNDPERSRRGGPDLESLAYLNAAPIPEALRGKQGVVWHDSRAHGRYTLVNPCFRRQRDAPPEIQPVHEAQLWDMQGTRVHAWRSDALGRAQGWAIARLDDHAYLHVVVADAGLIKLDWESNVVWAKAGPFHHDVNFDIDGAPVVVTQRAREVPRSPEGPPGPPVTLLEDGVAFLGRDGEVREEVWLYEALKELRGFQAVLANWTKQMQTPRGRAVIEFLGGLDVMHLNAIKILRADVAGLGKRGDLLVSLRQFSTIAVIDRKTHGLRWWWGPRKLQHQHDPSVAADGRVVVFDNRDRKGRSRVVFVDPTTRSIDEVFGGGETLRFFSEGRGLAQSLAGGNLVVFASNEGRVFEVTRHGERVWDFYGPWIQADKRLPLRGERLVGAADEAVAAILAGEAEPPAAP